MKDIAVVYKKSVYRRLFLEGGRQLAKQREGFSAADVTRLKTSHDLHEGALARVTAGLRRRGLRFRTIYRTRRLNYAAHDLVVSVGGDGTFLEASHRLTTETILGVNSNPGRSTGVFCAATAETFEPYLDAILGGRAVRRRLNRLAVRIDGQALDRAVLNEVLLANASPAAMSRYRLTVGETTEIHRNSGLWISTAAGSTGAVHSAGGRVLPLGSRRIQYRPRELYRGMGETYALTGGCVRLETSLGLVSMMRKGMLFIDGDHARHPAPFGTCVEVDNSRFPLRVVTGIRPG